MISKQDILAAVHKIKETQHRPKQHRLVNAKRDWFLLFSFTLVIVCVLLVWSIFTFLQLSQDDNALPASVEKVPKYQQNSFEEVVKIHQERSGSISD